MTARRSDDRVYGAAGLIGGLLVVAYALRRPS